MELDAVEGGSGSRTQIKLMYFGPVPPNTSLPTFRRRWRQHGALAMGMSYWRHMARYEQLDVQVPASLGLEGVVDSSWMAYGGVGIIWFHDLDSLMAAAADPANDIMRGDELEAFGGHLGERLVPTVEHRVHGSGVSDVDLVIKLRRRGGLGRAELVEALDDVAGRLLRSPQLMRHVETVVQNIAIEGIEHCDGYLQLGFSSPADIAALAREPDARLLWEDLALLLDGTAEMVVTRRTVLFDQHAG